MAARGSHFPPFVRQDDRDTRRLLEVAWSQHSSPSIDQLGSTWWLETESTGLFGTAVLEDKPGSNTSRAPLTWLRQTFGHCLAGANDQTITFHYRAWVLYLFSCVLFPNVMGDNASWMFLPCLTDWDTAGVYTWGSAVLAFLYR